MQEACDEKGLPHPDVISEFKSIFQNHGLGSDADLDQFIAFDPL